MADSIIDPFHRDLYGALTEEIDKRMTALASGSAVKVAEDTTSTAEKYAAQTSYIQALTDVLEKCKDVELARYGARPSAADAEQ